MPKRRRSIKATKKKAPVKEKGKKSQKEEVSSNSGEEASDVEVEESKEINDSRTQDELELEDERIDHVIKVELFEQFASFEGFVAYMEPVIHKIERLTSQKDSKDISEEDEKDDKRKEVSDPSKIFHIYGALLKKILQADLTQKSLFFNLHKLEEEEEKGTKGARDQPSLRDYVREDLLAIIKKKRVKSLEKSKLKFNIEHNDALDTDVHLDEEALHPILLELIQRYETAIKGFSEHAYRKTYFDRPAPKEDEPKDKKKKKGGKKPTKTVEPPPMTLEEKVEKVISDLIEEFGKPQEGDMDIETEKPGKKRAAQKKTSEIGGSFEIVAADKNDKMDEERIESNAKEQELRERLLEEYNEPLNFIKRLEDNSIRFKTKLFDQEKIHNCSFYTVLLACIVFGRRVARVSEELTDPTTIENLLEVTKFIPITLPVPVQKLHKKIVVSKALDFILEHELENCMPHTAYQKASNRFNEETHEMNMVSLKLCPHLCKLYQHESSLISTDTYNRFEIYKKQLDILVNTYKYFAEETNNPNSTPSKASGKVSLSKIEVLYADAKQVSGIDEYDELEFLQNEFRAARKAEKGDIIEEEPIKGRGSKRGSKSPNPKSNKMDIEDESSESEKTGKNSASKGKISATKEAKKSIKKGTPTKEKGTPTKEKGTPKKEKGTPTKEKASLKKEPEPPREFSEHELNLKLNRLKSKMTLEEAEQKLEELQEDADGYEDEIARLQKQIKHAKDWLYQYKEAIIIENKNLSNVGDLIEDLDELDVRAEEMELLLERVIRYSTWKKKFNAAVELMKRSWKTPSKDMEIETKLQIAQKDKKFEMISLKELQEILAESNDLDLDKNEESQLKDLKFKATQARNLQEKIAENLPKVFDIKTLTAYENEINNLRIKLPQMETIQLRKQLNEEVVDLLNEVTTIEQIEEFFQNSDEREDEINSEKLKKLRRKLYEGKKLRATAEDFIQKKLTLKYEDINHVRSMVKEIEDLRIGFDEAEKLSDILKTYAWLLKLYSLIQEDTIKADSYEKLFTIDLEGPLPLFDVDEVLIVCKEFIEDKANNEERFSALRGTIESGEAIRMFDSRVEQLCEDYFSKLWFSEGEEVFSRIKTSKELERFLKDGPKHIIDRMNEETLQRAQDELQRTQEWKKLYNETITPNAESHFRWKLEKELRDPAKREKVMDLKWKLSKLDSEYTIDLAKYTDLEKSSFVVQKYLNWINWCLRVEETMNNIENGIKIASFKDLKELHTDAVDFEIPKNLDFHKRVENWYNIATEILKDYRHKLENEKAAIHGQRATPKSIDKDSVRKVADKYKNRPSQTDAIRMKNELEHKTSFISFSEEIEKIKHVLHEYEKWQLKLQDFLNNDCKKLLESAKDKDHILEDHELIQKEIGYLKIDFAILELRNEEDEFKLTSLEWQYRTYLLMKNLNKDADIEEWKKLIRYANENPEVDPTFGKVFTKFLKEEMINFKKYHKTVKSLMNKEKSKELETVEDVERLLAHLQKVLIKRAEDEKFLEELIAKTQKLVTRANELVKLTQKEQLIEFTKTLDQIKLFPVALKTEQSMLETTIDIANKLASFVRRHSDMAVESVEKALVEYSKCPIKLTEVEKLQENYEESKVAYQKLQEEVSRLNQLTSPTFEEIHDLSQKVDTMKWDHDGQLNQIKMQLYLQKFTILQTLANAEEDMPNPITVQTLKSFVIDGQNLKKHIGENRRLDQAVFWIDNLFRKAEDKVRELNLIKSPAALDQISTTILKVVDYSQEIIERKAVLTAGTAAPLPQHQLRLQQEDEEYKAGPKKSTEKKGEKGKQSTEKKDEKGKKRSVSKSDEAAKERKSRSPKGMNKENTKRKSEKKPEKKPEKNFKPANPVGTIQELLEKNHNIFLSSKEAKNYAETIADAFPLVKHSKEKLERFCELLKNVLKYENIATSLVTKKFDCKEISQLIKRKESELASLEEKLNDPTKRKGLKPPTKPLEPSNKKVKTDDSSKNILDSSARMGSQPSRGSSKRSGDNIDSKDIDLTQKSTNTNRQFRDSLRSSVQDDSMELERPDKGLKYRNTISSNLSIAEQRTQAQKRASTSQYEADNESRQTRETNITRNLPLPAGSKPVYRIFNGVVKTTEETALSKVGFYSCNVLETIKEVPQIIDGQFDTVRIQEKVSERKFAEYIERLLEIYDPSQDFLVTGWIEANSVRSQAQCEEVANDFFETKSVGLTKYLDCAKIFFLHKGQIPSEWARRLGFRVQKIHRAGSLASLAFILIYQPAKSSINVSRLQKIVPEPISTLQEYSKGDDVMYTRETSNTIDSVRGRQLERELSGPQTPDVQSNYERGLSRNASLMDVEPSLQSEHSRSRSLKPPTFNIKPEFMNMDSNAQDSNTFQSSRRSKQSANEQRGRGAENFPQGLKDPYNEGMYEEEMNYEENFQPQSRGFNRGGFSREQSNDNSRGSGRQPFNKWQNQGTYKKYTENPRQGNVRNMPANRTPTKSPSTNETNPFYLEYLKNKAQNPVLSSSPIAQKFLGRSSNPTGRQQNFPRSNYPSQNVGQGNFTQRDNFNQRGNYNPSQKYQSFQNPSIQRSSRPEGEKKGGFVYSNQMNDFSSTRYQKPYSQNYQQKKQWHELLCTTHSKKAECFCLKKDCKLKLACFSCCKLHDHDEQIRNIIELFAVSADDYTLNSETMTEFEQWLLEMSQTFQKKFASITSFLRRMTNLFEESETKHARVRAFNSIESLVNSSRPELQELYKKCQFDKKIKDGAAMERLIECYVKILERFENNCPKSISEKLKENVKEVVTTVDKLNDQLKVLVELFDSVGLTSIVNLKCEKASSTGLIRNLKSEYQTPQEATVGYSDWCLDKNESSKLLSGKESLPPCRTVAKDSSIEEERGSILQNDEKIDHLPEVSELNTQRDKNIQLNYYTQNELIEEFDSTNQRHEASIGDQAFTNKAAAAQTVEADLSNSERMHQEYPAEDKLLISNRIVSVLNQTNPKPKLDELLLLAKEATQTRLSENWPPFKELKELAQEAEKLLKKYNLVTQAYSGEAEAFKNKITNTLSAHTVIKDSQSPHIELDQIKKYFKDLRAKVTTYVRSKLKTKEELSSIVTELQESKIEFSREANDLQNLFVKAEFNLSEFTKKLESADSDKQKIGVSQFNQGFLELFEYPLRSEDLTKLIKQFFSIQKLRGELINVIQEHSGLGLNANEAAQDDEPAIENAKKLIRRMKSKKFQKIDFEVEGERITEIAKGPKRRKSDQLKDNLPQDAQPKKKIADPKTKRKSKSFDTKKTSAGHESSATKLDKEAAEEKQGSGLIKNIWNLQKISTDFLTERMNSTNISNSEKKALIWWLNLKFRLAIRSCKMSVCSLRKRMGQRILSLLVTGLI